MWVSKTGSVHRTATNRSFDQHFALAVETPSALIGVFETKTEPNRLIQRIDKLASPMRYGNFTLPESLELQLIEEIVVHWQCGTLTLFGPKQLESCSFKYQNISFIQNEREALKPFTRTSINEGSIHADGMNLVIDSN